MSASIRVAAAAAALAALMAGLPAASAAECVWGQPGYRACVDDLMAKRKALEEQAANGNPEAKAAIRFPTAPARNRAPQLTPLDQYATQPGPVPRAPKGRNPTDENQRMLDDTFMRTQRDAERPAIMPRGRDIFTFPGRICPSQGC